MFGIGGSELILVIIILVIAFIYSKNKSPKKIIDLKPIAPVAEYNIEKYTLHKERGLSLWSQGDKKGAVVELEKALKSNPDCVETWCKLGDWYDFLSSSSFLNSEGDENALRHKAIDALNKAIELQPDNAKAHDMLGNVLWAIDFRKALAEHEIAAKYDPQFNASVDHARRVVEECTYKLSNLKTIGLKSLQERPLPQMFNNEFYFDGDVVKSAVMFSCVSGTMRQWMHAWLFGLENPDLFQESPVAEVAFSSTGDVSVSKGCPQNYRAVIEELYKEDLL